MWKTFVCLLALALTACPGKKPAADADPGFELTVPVGFKQVTPTGPLLAAWEAPVFRNGFTPTINVASQKRPAGTPDEVYLAWRDHLQKTLARMYVDVKILSERELPASGTTGRLVILVCQLEVPGGVPMPIFAYAALFHAGERQFTVAALTGASLDVATSAVTPIGEPEILAALASFRPR